MAQMYPALIPSDAPPSERKVYNHLKSLDDKIHVIWGQRRSEGRADYETDFIVIDPDRTLLVLEVKGGRIARGDGRWTSTDRNGDVYEINPVAQATRAKYYYRDLFSRKYDIAWGIVFPDVDTNGAVQLGDDTRRNRVIDATDLQDLQGSLKRVFDDNKVRQNSASEQFVDDVLSILLPKFDLVQSLSSRIEEERRMWIRLAGDQVRILDFLLDNNSRVLVEGTAGTGKTIIAIEAARRAANSGKRALYLCYNRPLQADVLRHSYSIGAGDRALFDVWTYDRLRNSVLEDTKHVEVPGDAVGPTDRVTALWDAVFVDEGQDFDQDTWAYVSQLTCNGTLWIFHDPHQQTRVPGPSIVTRALENATFTQAQLKQNFRNTKAIATMAANYIQEQADSPDSAPDGTDVQEIDACGPWDCVRMIVEKLSCWIGGGLDPSRIAVISALKHNQPAYGDVKKIVERQLCSKGDMRVLDNMIRRDENSKQEPYTPRTRPRWCTADRFKGLEADAVVLISPHDYDSGRLSGDEAERMLYIGASRARHYLTILRAPSDELAVLFWNEFYAKASPLQLLRCSEPLVKGQLWREIAIDGTLFLSVGLNRHGVRVFVRGALVAQRDDAEVVDRSLSARKDEIEAAIEATFGEGPCYFVKTRRVDNLWDKNKRADAIDWILEQVRKYLVVLDRGFPIGSQMRSKYAIYVGLLELARKDLIDQGQTIFTSMRLDEGDSETFRAAFRKVWPGASGWLERNSVADAAEATENAELRRRTREIVSRGLSGKAGNEEAGCRGLFEEVMRDCGAGSKAGRNVLAGIFKQELSEVVGRETECARFDGVADIDEHAKYLRGLYERRQKDRDKRIDQLAETVIERVLSEIGPAYIDVKTANKIPEEVDKKLQVEMFSTFGEGLFKREREAVRDRFLRKWKDKMGRQTSGDGYGSNDRNNRHDDGRRRKRGVVIRLNGERGYGFIRRTRKDARGLYFHRNEVEGRFEDFKVGVGVTYEVGSNNKGECAINVNVEAAH